MMRDLIIAVGVLFGCWSISLLVHAGRVATAHFLDTASRFLSTARFHFRLFGLDTETNPDRMQLIVPAIRWTFALGRRIHHVYSTATASDDAPPSPVSWPRRWYLASDAFHLCLRIVRQTRMPALLGARSRDFTVRRARSMPWMVGFFAVSLS